MLLRCAGRTGRVVTVEDHSISGDPGRAVAEVLGEPGRPQRLAITGFGESGDPRGLQAKHGLDPPGIALSVNKFLDR
jgi:transketolase